MGFLNKLLVGGGAAAIGVVTRACTRMLKKHSARESSPLCFDDSLSQSEFVEIRLTPQSVRRGWLTLS